MLDEREPVLRVRDELLRPVDDRGRLGVGALAAGEILVSDVAEGDEFVGNGTKPVIVVHRLPRAGERAGERVAGHHLKEVILLVEAVGEVGVGRDPSVRGVTRGVVAGSRERLDEGGGALQIGVLLVGTVLTRGEAGEQGGVDGEGPRRGGDGLLEDGRLGGEVGETGRRRPVVAVGGEVVRPHRVHDDEEDVSRRSHYSIYGSHTRATPSLNPTSGSHPVASWSFVASAIVSWT